MNRARKWDVHNLNDVDTFSIYHAYNMVERTHGYIAALRLRIEQLELRIQNLEKRSS